MTLTLLSRKRIAIQPRFVGSSLHRLLPPPGCPKLRGMAGMNSSSSLTVRCGDMSVIASPRPAGASTAEAPTHPSHAATHKVNARKRSYSQILAASLEGKAEMTTIVMNDCIQGRIPLLQLCDKRCSLGQRLTSQELHSMKNDAISSARQQPAAQCNGSCACASLPCCKTRSRRCGPKQSMSERGFSMPFLE